MTTSYEEIETESQRRCLQDGRPNETNAENDTESQTTGFSFKAALINITNMCARYVRHHKIVFAVTLILMLAITVLVAMLLDKSPQNNCSCIEDESTHDKAAPNSQKGNPKNADNIIPIPSRCQISVRPPNNKTVGITCGDISLDIFTKNNLIISNAES